MASLQSETWAFSPIQIQNSFSRKQSSVSLSTATDDSFEVVGDDSICWLPSSKYDDFEVDLELEEQAIRQYNAQRTGVPCFDYLHIGKSNQELRYIQKLSVYGNFEDIYSCQDKDEIVVVSGKLTVT